MNTRTSAKAIGRFELSRVLGEGAQGTVYLARDPHLGREVAIKTLALANTGRAATVTRLLQEARLVSRLNHPNVVTLYDAGETAGAPYLVFEYVPGETLDQRLARERKMQPPRATEIALEILAGLEHAHEQGILHRDIKPGNIIFGSDGKARIMDFGIATPMSETGSEGFTATPLYAAPEYVATQAYTKVSDLYAVAVVLYEMLTGQAPFSGSNVNAVLQRVRNENPKSPSQIVNAIDEELNALVLRGLEKMPEKRFESAQAFAAALRAWRDPKTLGSGTVGDGNSSAIEFLLRRMRVKSEFPALSDSIRNINRITASDRESAAALSRAVLKDFALTNRLLKIVNAATYGHYGKVSTVSRAVVMVGFEVVRNLAVSLMFLDHLQNKNQAEGLKEDVIGSLYTGFVARQLAGGDLRDSEEVFICALYQNLGKMLATYYFHEESLEIEKQVATGKFSEDQAANQVLGVSYEQLGIEIARTWNFPGQILQSMQKLPPGKAPVPKSASDRLRAISNLASEIRAVSSVPEAQREQRLNEITARYTTVMPLNRERLERVTQGAVQELVRDAAVYKVDIKQSLLLRQATTAPASSAPPAPAPGADMLGEAELEKTLINDDSTSPGDAALAGKPANAAAILSAGIQDITNTLVSEYKLNDLLNMIMETMYRGMGFTRVLLAVRDARSGNIAARFALGENSDVLLKWFSFPLTGAPDLFRLAVSQGRDILISDAGTEKVRAQLPDWYRQQINAAAFVLFPIVVGKNPVGLFYADVRRGPLEIAREEANLLVTLRNQAVLAFRQASAR
jgi:serine/threonine protein kinase